MHSTNPHTIASQPEHSQQQRGRSGRLAVLQLTSPLPISGGYHHANKIGKDIKTTKTHILPSPCPVHTQQWTSMLCFPSAAVLACSQMSGLIVLQNQTSSFLSKCLWISCGAANDSSARVSLFSAHRVAQLKSSYSLRKGVVS